MAHTERGRSSPAPVRVGIRDIRAAARHLSSDDPVRRLIEAVPGESLPAAEFLLRAREWLLLLEP